VILTDKQAHSRDYEDDEIVKRNSSKQGWDLKNGPATNIAKVAKRKAVEN